MAQGIGKSKSWLLVSWLLGIGKSKSWLLVSWLLEIGKSKSWPSHAEQSKYFRGFASIPVFGTARKAVSRPTTFDASSLRPVLLVLRRFVPCLGQACWSCFVKTCPKVINGNKVNLLSGSSMLAMVSIYVFLTCFAKIP